MVTTAIAGDTLSLGARPPERARAVGCGTPAGGTALAFASAPGPVETGPPGRRTGTASDEPGRVGYASARSHPAGVRGARRVYARWPDRLRAASGIRPGCPHRARLSTDLTQARRGGAVWARLGSWVFRGLERRRSS